MAGPPLVPKKSDTGPRLEQKPAAHRLWRTLRPRENSSGAGSDWAARPRLEDWLRGIRRARRESWNGKRRWNETFVWKKILGNTEPNPVSRKRVRRRGAHGSWDAVGENQKTEEIKQRRRNQAASRCPDPRQERTETWGESTERGTCSLCRRTAEQRKGDALEQETKTIRKIYGREK
jgi:hypothetical protein